MMPQYLESRHVERRIAKTGVVLGPDSRSPGFGDYEVC
jgi:hypothetical protein